MIPVSVETLLRDLNKIKSGFLKILINSGLNSKNMPEHGPHELLSSDFFVALSFTVQNIATKRYEDPSKYREPGEKKLMDLYVLTRDYLAWCALIYRLWRGNDPRRHIDDLVGFIKENSRIQITASQLTKSLDRSLSPATVSQFVNGTNIEKYDVNSSHSCYTCCFKNVPPGCKDDYDRDDCMYDCINAKI
jgi:predicted DNA-binding transcriptional regulator YafY